jgi:hypothetical protein
MIERDRPNAEIRIKLAITDPLMSRYPREGFLFFPMRGAMMNTNNNALIGTWKLVPCFMEDVETNEKKLAWGKDPNGIIVLTSEGRWIVI